MNRKLDQTAVSGETPPTGRCVATCHVGGSGCHAQAQGAGMSVSAAHQHGGAALRHGTRTRHGTRAHVWGASVAVVVTALLVAGGPTTQAQTLTCATVSGGGGVLPNGSIVTIGQPVTGTMSNAQFTIGLGTVPCLLAGNVTQPPPLPPLPLTGAPGFRKDRYVSFDPTTNGTNSVAIRVTRVGSTTDMFVDCTTLVDKGADGWYVKLHDPAVGLPAPPDPAYYCDWSIVTTGLHVRGCSVVPGNSYDVAMTVNGSAFSTALVISTTPPPAPARAFGDTVGGLVAGIWTPPDGLVTTNDIVAAVKKFALSPDAPIMARIDTDGAVPNAVISSSDVLRAVRGFAGDDFGNGVTGCKTTGVCVPPQPGDVPPCE